MSPSLAAQPLAGDTLAWEVLGDRTIPVDGLAVDDLGGVWVGDGRIFRLDLSDGPPGSWVRVNNGSLYDQLLPLQPTTGAGRIDTLLAGSNGVCARSLDGGVTFVLSLECGGENGFVEVTEGPLRGWILVPSSSDQAVLVSEDRGATWREADIETPTTWNPMLATLALPSGRVLAGGPNGILVSDDSVRTFHPSSYWEELRYGAYQFVTVERPPGHPLGPGLRVIATVVDQTEPRYRVSVSDDEGETWTQTWVIVDPQDPGPTGSPAALLPLGGSGALLLLRLGAVLATADGGQTWAEAGRVPLDPEARVASAALGPDGRLYVGQLVRGYVRRTAGPVVAVANEPPPAPGGGAPGVALAVAPNPARGAATLTLTLGAGAASARVAVYDGLGREVALLHAGPLGAGRHAWRWAGARAAGVYLVRAAVGDRGVTRRLTVLR